MRALLWLILFFVVANALGTAIVLVGFRILEGVPHDQGEGLGALWIVGFLGLDLVFGGPILMAAAAATVRRRVGKITGFTAGATAVVICSLLGWLLAGQVGGALAGAKLGFTKLLGAVLLARIPLFRAKALDLVPPSRLRGLCGTYAVSMDPNESPAGTLGRRPADERRWVLRRAIRPVKWASMWNDLPPPARRVEGGTVFLHDRAALLAWMSLPSGALAAFAVYTLHRDSTLAKAADPAYGFATAGLALLALSLLRFGLMRIYERFRLLHLLREGEVVKATRSTDALFDLRSVVITVGETSDGRLLVASPAPQVAGDVQGVLVGKNGDVVAWDLLPFTPAVDGTGVISAGAGMR